MNCRRTDILDVSEPTHDVSEPTHDVSEQTVGERTGSPADVLIQVLFLPIKVQNSIVSNIINLISSLIS